MRGLRRTFIGRQARPIVSQSFFNGFFFLLSRIFFWAAVPVVVSFQRFPQGYGAGFLSAPSLPAGFF